MAGATERLDPLALSPKDAAAMLGVSRAHIYDLIGKREVESRLSGSRRLVDYQSLKAYYSRLKKTRPRDVDLDGEPEEDP